MARWHRPAADRCPEPSRPPSEEKSGHVSHPSLRSTLVPLASGLAAVIAVCGLCGATPALGAVSAAGAARAGGTGSAAGTSRAASVRAQEWWLTSLQVTQAWPTSQGSGVTVAVLGT